MTVHKSEQRKSSWSTILGFACNQSFLYALFYLEPKQGLKLMGMSVERAEQMGVLLFMFLAFYAVGSLSPKLRNICLSPRFVLAYAVILVLGAGVPAFAGTQDLLSLAYESICVGIPSALMLCSWASALGGIGVKACAPEVFAGLGLGAVICFVFSLVPLEGAYSVLYFAPLGSAILLKRIVNQEALAHSRPSDSRTFDESVVTLSLKILIGTALFGFAVGLIEVDAHRFASVANTIPVTFLLFVLFCVAALQMFEPRRSAVRQSVEKPDRASFAKGRDEGPLDGSYRLAVLLMVSGFLLAPFLDQWFGVSGESIVLVGYLGLTAVLITLFLLMAYVLSHDAPLAFARGFMALFAGEFLGLVVANLVYDLVPFAGVSSALCAFAGIIVLVAYLFLFTNGDMRELSVAVERADSFELALEKIITDAGLSKRESEILPFVLRGRSSERIAGELYISKNTVDTHIRKIYLKCGVHSRQELLDLAEGVQSQLR